LLADTQAVLWKAQYHLKDMQTSQLGVDPPVPQLLQSLELMVSPEVEI
jgi:hypothetical protein